MDTIGAFEAKTHLSLPLERAAKDESFTITRHGKPVVTLTPTDPTPKPLTDEYLKGMRERATARPSLGGDSVTLVREMRDEER